MTFDKSDKLDVTSRLHPGQARKWLTEVLRSYGIKIVTLSTHCRQEMKKDALTPFDIYDALKDGQIYDYPELEKESYRYRVETKNIIVIVAFQEPNLVRCVTAWRKS